MTEPGAPPAPRGPEETALPDGLVSAVVNLVNTGPVMLGAYTTAELTAVDAVVDFLQARPSDEVLAEAVRSLAARQLLVAGSGGTEVRVQGDLGITVAFERRARMVLDARVTGTDPGEPWRVLLLPQPEKICLRFCVDALGGHEIGLYDLDEALGLLADWLPSGDRADPDPGLDADQLLASADRSALLTLTRYTTQGSAETAGSSTDLALARRDGQLYVLTRHPDDQARLVPRSDDGQDVRELVADLLS